MLLSGIKSVTNFNMEWTYWVCDLMQRRRKDLQVRLDLTIPDSCFALWDMPLSSNSMGKNKVDTIMSPDLTNLDLGDQNLMRS